MSRARALPAVSAVVLVAAIVAAAALGAAERVPHRAPALRLTGHVTGLYPGARRRLTIVVRNHTTRMLRVRSVTTDVRDASRRCTGRNLHVSAYRGALRVAPHGMRRVRVNVAMSPRSPSACQGAVFRLAFRAVATAA